MATQLPTVAAVAVLLVGILLARVSTLPQLEREPEFPTDVDEDDTDTRYLTSGWPGNDVHPGRPPSNEWWQPDDWRPPFFPTTTRRATGRQQPTRRPELDWPLTPPQDLDWRPRPPQGPRRTTPSEGDWSIGNRPTTTRPVFNRPTTNRPTTNRPITNRPSTNRPTTNRPTTNRPTTNRPTTNRPITNRPIMNRPTTGRPVPSRPTTNRPTTSRATPSSSGTTQQDCNCPSTNEFNPVCGTDGVSYPNPGRLRCAKDCGKSVSVYHIGNCVSTSTTPPRSTAPSFPS